MKRTRLVWPLALLFAMACEQERDVQPHHFIDDSPVVMELPISDQSTGRTATNSRYMVYSAHYLATSPYHQAYTRT